MSLFSPLSLALLVMVVGLAGTMLPLIPGLPVILATAVAYFWLVTGWTPWTIFATVVITLLFVAGLVLDYVIAPTAARQGGASCSTTLLAGIAGIVGFFVLPLIGAILLPIGVVLVIEYLRERDARRAGKAAGAYLVGWVASNGLKFLTGIAMIAAFWLAAAR